MPSNYDAFMDEGNATPQGDGGSERSLKGKLSKKANQVRNAFKIRDDAGIDKKWSDLIQIYSNKYPWDELSHYDEIVVPNMAFSTVNVIVPSVAIHAPKIEVRAEKEAERDAAEVAQAVVNHQWREYDVQDQVRDAVKDFVIVGLGWCKTVWETEDGERELSVPEWQEQVRTALMEYQQAVATSPLDEDEFPTVEEVIEGVPQVVTEIVRDAPKVTRVSPFDMIVDPDALRLEDARWIAQRSFIPVEVAKKNKDWEAGARRKLKPTRLAEARDTVDVNDERRESKDAGFVVVYEFYDLLSGDMCVFADGCQEFLMKPEKSPFPDVHPFTMFENFEVPERFEPIGDLEMIYGLQLELALTRTAMVNDRKHGKRVGMVRSQSIGPEGLDQLESGDDNVLIDVLEDRPFDDVYRMISPTALHPEWYSQSDMIVNDINMISGVSEYARGQMPEIKRTATEAGLIQDAANARSADKLWKVESGMAKIGELMIRLSQQFLDTEGVAKGVDEDQVVSWVQYDRNTIQGSFSFVVEAGSSQPQNESFRRQSALQFMDAMSPAMGTGLLNDQKVLEYVMRHGFGIRNAEEFLGQGPPPMPPGPEGMPPEAPPGAEGMPPPMPGMM